MQDDYRRLQPVKLDVVGVETGTQRYPKNGDYLAPRVAHWRNNLTAASNRHNLFFIAYLETVAVFQSSTPSHRLGSRPNLNLLPTLANSDAQGFLDTARPHCVNHLIVGDLGSEEILLLSTDSGNVAAYYTAAILEGVDKEPYKYSTDGRADLVGVRSFFTHWVYESAWGLSIHKNARMLAVSANRPPDVPPGEPILATVTVFAFALTRSEKCPVDPSEDEIAHEGVDDCEWNLWVPKMVDHVRMPDRSVNWKTRVQCHGRNIPSIAFVNSDEDPHGEYLASTDIGGNAKLLHIWQAWPVNEWNLSLPEEFTDGYLPSKRRLGWTILPMDPSCFRVVDTMEEFCGIPYRKWNLRGHIDLSPSLPRIPGHDRSLPAAVHQHDGDDYDEIEEVSEDSDVDEDFEEEVVELRSEVPGSNAAALDAIDSDTTSTSDDHSQFDEDELRDSEFREDSSTAGSLEYEPPVVDHDMATVEWAEVPVPRSLRNSDGYHTEVASPGVEKLKGARSSFLSQNWVPSLRTPPPKMPTLLLSSSYLRLVVANSPAEPSISCPRLLADQTPTYCQCDAHIDRLNMIQHIPELGVVVIATQIGRAAVCTLTRKGSTGPFGLRVDWILPFQEQEEAHQRPSTTLVGIAVGPVPGYEFLGSGSVSSSSDEGEMDDDTAMRDRVDENGVSISYDHDMIIASPSFAGEMASRAKLCGTPCKRSATSTSKSSSPHSASSSSSSHLKKNVRWTTAHHTWSTRSESNSEDGGIESWAGTDYSRRYRLMMSYADHTVLTYELSRQPPYWGDPSAGEPNWRNREAI